MAGGRINHTPDPRAPFGSLARYGYLVPLQGEALEDYQACRARLGIKGAMGDQQRWDWEDQWIKKQIEKQKKSPVP